MQLFECEKQIGLQQSSYRYFYGFKLIIETSYSTFNPIIFLSIFFIIKYTYIAIVLPQGSTAGRLPDAKALLECNCTVVFSPTIVCETRARKLNMSGPIGLMYRCYQAFVYFGSDLPEKQLVFYCVQNSNIHKYSMNCGYSGFSEYGGQSPQDHSRDYALQEE